VELLEARDLPSVNVLTYHYDNQSTGQNLNETTLTPANVNSTSFGKLFSMPVDGQVYAQPLYMSGVNITTGSNQGTHNVVFIATEHDSLYAFDADNGTLLWHDTLLTAEHGGTVTTVPAADTNETGDLIPEIGITSTPVINPNGAAGTIYVEAKTKEVAGSSNHYEHHLYAIDVGSGNIINKTLIADSIGDTYVSGPTVNGTGETPSGTPSGRVAFDALRQMNRPGLTLSNGNIYMAFASHGDNQPYHGWVLGFSAATLAPTAVFNTTPNGAEGGIWQGGASITVDAAGNLYLETGNGTFDTTLTANAFTNGKGLNVQVPNQGDYGDAFIRLTPDSTTSQQSNNPNGWGLHVSDYFTPFNQASLNNSDFDLGSGGPFLLPDSVGSSAHPHLLVGSGKEGRIYLIDRDNMGGFNSSTDNVVQELGPNTISGSFGTGAYFNGAIYYVGGSNIGNPNDKAKT
jgi:outer membrane protein assembly factor BamB